MSMASISFSTADAVTNAMAALSAADRARCLAHPQLDGTYLVTAPDDLESALTRPHPTATLPVPVEISRAQGKIQLSRAGLLGTVRDVVTATGGEVEIWFSDAATWRRDSPYIAQLAAALDPPLSSAAVDQHFRDAAQISA